MTHAFTPMSIAGQAAGMRRRLLEGIPLTVFTTGFGQGVALLSTVVLARLLTPSDFGLISMGILAFYIAMVFTDAQAQGLVQSALDPRVAANTAFLLVLLIGSALCGAIVLASPLLAGFFGQQDLPPVLAVLAIGYMAGIIGRVPVALLEKSMDYRRRAIPQVVAPLAQAVVSVGLAVASHGALAVWALAWGQVAYWVSWSVSGWAAANWRPSLQFDRQVARELLAFTRDMAGLAGLGLLVRNIDNVIVGKFLGPAELGLYAMAYRVSHLPRDVLSASVARALFPAFVRLQDDPSTLHEVHRFGLKIEAALSFPMIALLIVIAPDFIPLVLGEKWQATVVPLQVLAVSGLARSLITVDQTLITAIGHRKRAYPGAIVVLVLVTLLLYPAVQIGIVAVAAAVSVALLVGLVISQVLAARAAGLTLAKYVAPLWGPAIAAVTSAAAASWIFHSLPGALSLAEQVAMAASMAAIYAGTLLLIDRDARGVLRRARAWRSTRGAQAAPRQSVA